MKKLITILILLSVPVLGQINHTLKTIIVEGKKEADALQKRKESAFPLIVLTSRQINGFGHQTAGDVIKNLPRLYMQGPLNLQRNVKMAGLDKEFQCILINGVRPFGGADRRDIKLDRIPVNMIEEIEVYTNPPSKLVSDAISGVVNIIMKKNVSDNYLNAGINTGTQTISKKLNKRGYLDYSTRIENLSIIAGLSIDDYYRTVESDISKFTMRGDDTENIDVTTFGVNLSLNYSFRKSNILFTPYFTNYKEFTDIKTINKLGKIIYEKQYDTEDKLRRLQNYSLEFSHRLSPTSKLLIQTVLGSNREEKFKVRDKKTLNANEFKYEDDVQNVDDYVLISDYSFFLSGLNMQHFLNTGINFRFNDRKVDRIVSFKASPQSKLIPSNESYTLDETLFSFYLQDKIIISNEINLLAGLRYEYAKNNFLFGKSDGIKTYSFLNPSLSVSVKLTETLFAKSSFSRQLSRAPYMYMVPIVKRKNRKTEMGNTKLNPSLSYNFDFSLQKYINKTDYIIFSGYYKNIDDIIEQVYVGNDNLNNDNPIFKAVNISKAEVYGVDLEIGHSFNRVLKFFSTSLNASWFGSSLKDPRTARTRRLKNQPEYIFNLLLKYANPNTGLDITIGLNHIGKKIDPESSEIELVTDPFTQIDCQIKYYLNNNFSVYLTGKNILGSKVKSTHGNQFTTENFGSILRIGVNYRIF